MGSSGTHSLHKTHMPRILVGRTSGGIHPKQLELSLESGNGEHVCYLCTLYTSFLLFLYAVTKDVERETISGENRNSLDS